MEIQEIKANKEDKLLQYGLISALASSLLFVLLYIGGLDWFKNKLSFLTGLIPVVFAIIACRNQRKAEGSLPFRKALRLSFGIFVVTSLATSLLSYILFNWIDTSFAESLKQLAIEQTQLFMEKFKVPVDEIDKTIDKMLKENMFSLKSIFSSFIYGCIVYFLISLIIAAIMKKEKEIFTS